MKKVYYIPIAILLLLIITNPTMQDFKNHVGFKDDNNYSWAAKDKNFFVCSFYSYVFGTSSEYYLGIAGNFFVISTTTTK